MGAGRVLRRARRRWARAGGTTPHRGQGEEGGTRDRSHRLGSYWRLTLTLVGFAVAQHGGLDARGGLEGFPAAAASARANQDHPLTEGDHVVGLEAQLRDTRASGPPVRRTPVILPLTITGSALTCRARLADPPPAAAAGADVVDCPARRRRREQHVVGQAIGPDSPPGRRGAPAAETAAGATLPTRAPGPPAG